MPSRSTQQTQKVGLMQGLQTKTKNKKITSKVAELKKKKNPTKTYTVDV